MPATIRDVAKLAKTSIGAVSAVKSEWRDDRMVLKARTKVIRFGYRCSGCALIASFLVLLASASSDGTSRLYRVERQRGVWMFVAPNGGPFFSLGINCLNMGTPRDAYRPTNPSYASFRHYPDETSWTKHVLARMRAWNFNTIGGWSGPDAHESVVSARELLQTGIPYTIVLHLGGRLGAPFCDLFSEDIARKFDNLARELIAPYRDDPNLLGYFTDNEQFWEEASLFVHFLEQPEHNATRRVLIQLLRDHYNSDFSQLQRDFETYCATGFGNIKRLSMKTARRGNIVVEKFTYLLASSYYRLVHRAIRRYDRNHLILGDRYYDRYSYEVARAAVPYVDAISINHGADWKDGGNARYFLDTLYRLTKKPIVITEFYFCAMENRSGNKNSGETNFPTVNTQTAREVGFQTNLISFISLPYVIGAHWFQYYDEPTHGRYDGEDFNMGLVDINDQPYEGLTAVTASLDVSGLHRRSAVRLRPSKLVAIPMVQSDLAQGLDRWDRDRCFVPSLSRLPAADLYAVWDRKHLHIAVYTENETDLRLFPDGRVREDARREWTIRIGRSPVSARVRFASNDKASDPSPSAFREWIHHKRRTMIFSLSSSQYGKKSFRPGDVIRLRSRLTHSHPSRDTEWDTLLHLETPEIIGREYLLHVEGRIGHKELME